jgi:hypothetical protein
MRAGDRLAPPVAASPAAHRKDSAASVGRKIGFRASSVTSICQWGLASMFVREIACEIGKDGKGFALRAAWLSGRSEVISYWISLPRVTLNE